MASQSAAALRETITIQAPAEAPDASGGVAQTWYTSWSGKAAVTDLKGEEKWAAKQVVGKRVVKFRLRYLAGVHDKMRVLWEGRSYDLTDVSWDPKRTWLFLSGYEVEA